MKRSAEVIKQPVAVVILTFAVLLCTAVLRGAIVPYPSESNSIDFSPLAELIDGWFDGSIVWTSIVAALLATVNAVIITRIITRYSVTVVKTLIPTVLFVILSCSVFFAVGHPSVGVLIFAVTRSSELMIAAFRREASYGKVMSSAFWLGVAVLIYPAASLFIVVAPLIMLIYKRSPREIVTGLIFIFVPIILAGFGWWFAGYEPLYIAEGIADGFARSMQGVDWNFLVDGTLNIATLVTCGVAALIVVASIALFFFDFANMRLRLRNINIQFLLMTLCATVIMFSGGNPAVTVPLTGVCCVPLINNFFVRYGGIVGIVIYVVLTIGSLTGMALQFL